jgi:hypothetical protein
MSIISYKLGNVWKKALVLCLKTSHLSERDEENKRALEFSFLTIKTQKRRNYYKSKALPLHSIMALGGRGGIAPSHS